MLNKARNEKDWLICLRRIFASRYLRRKGEMEPRGKKVEVRVRAIHELPLQIHKICLFIGIFELLNEGFYFPLPTSYF